MSILPRQPTLEQRLEERREQLRQIQMSVPLPVAACGTIEAPSFTNPSDVSFLLFQLARNRRFEANETFSGSLQAPGLLVGLALNANPLVPGFSASEYVLQGLREEWSTFGGSPTLTAALRRTAQALNERIWLARQHNPALRNAEVHLVILGLRGQQAAGISFGAQHLCVGQNQEEIRELPLTNPLAQVLVGWERQVETIPFEFELPGTQLIWMASLVKPAVTWKGSGNLPMAQLCRLVADHYQPQGNSARFAMVVVRPESGSFGPPRGRLAQPAKNDSIEPVPHDGFPAQARGLTAHFPPKVILVYVGFMILAAVFLLFGFLRGGN